MALLVNDRESRASLAKALAASAVSVDEYPTVEKSLLSLTSVHYDLIAIHWQVFPGLEPGTPRMKRYAAALQKTTRNRSALHWAVALGPMDAIRALGSVNATTSIVAILPGIGRIRYDAGKRLTRESVDKDLAARQPACVIAETSIDQIAEELRRQLPGVAMPQSQ
jgi:hypothetical protein